MTPDELREAVWKAIMSSNTNTEAADAAIAIVLEQAAKVADAFPARTHGALATAPYAAAEQASDEIAAAIRALATASAPKPQSGE